LLCGADAVVRTTASRSLEKLGWKPGDDSQRVQQIVASGNLLQLIPLGAKAIGPLLELMRSGPPDKQFAAVKALGQITDPRVPPAMLEVLKKNDPALRTAALGILEHLADPSTYEGVERLLKDGNATVRGAAIEAAVSCGGNRAVPSLIRMLKDPSWEVRHITVKALGTLGDAAAVDGLCGMLDDSDRDVRESTIASLGKIGDRHAIPFLIPMLLDPENVLRAAAAAALRSIHRQWEKDESVAQVLPQIKAALDHNDYWVKHSAVKLFEQLGIDPNSIGTESGSVPDSTEAAPVEHPAFSILADLLFDLDRDLRLAAAEALGRLREKNAQPILAAAIHDEDNFVQAAAQAALAALN
jgi:HEAT repeat protein